MDNSQTVDVENGHAAPRPNSESPQSNSETNAWNILFAMSCMLAVSLDPLFLYIPFLNNDMKCVGLDKNVKIAAVVLRYFTDLIYILEIIFQIYKLKKFTSKEIWESYIFVNILAVLPIPQVLIFGFFTKMMRGSGSLITMNSLVLFQYVPRVFCIYLACKKCKISLEGKRELWLKGGLNFSLYILASNVFGAFWYFFSIQQMVACWQSACRSQSDDNECKSSAFDCHEQPTFRNMTLPYDLCPINPQNATLFDFGIFLNVLQPGIAGSTDYLKKLSNCFLWALRNLSSFGSNLQPSINIWENLFATSISIIGVLLFLYLLGKLQIYMGSETTIKEQERWNREFQGKRKLELRFKIESQIESWLLKNHLLRSRFESNVMEEVIHRALERNKDDFDVDDMISNLSDKKLGDYIKNYMDDDKKIDSWLEKKDIPMHFKLKIMEEVQEKRQGGDEFDVDPNKIFYLLSNNLRGEINEILSLACLKKVQLLQDMNEEGLKAFSGKLRHKRYTKGRTIIHEEKPLKKLLFIVDGVVSIEKRYCITRWQLKAGEFYGEKLLHWPSPTSSPGKLPEATESVKAKSDIEALVLYAKDLQSVVSDIQLNISREITISSNYEIDYLPMLKNVSELEKMDEEILKEISAVLEPKSYTKGTQIIKRGKKLHMMFFVTSGTVVVTRSSNERRQYEGGKLYGKELLVWALDMPETSLPSSAGTATADSNVDVLILKATDLRNVLHPSISDTESPTDSESDYEFNVQESQFLGLAADE